MKHQIKIYWNDIFMMFRNIKILQISKTFEEEAPKSLPGINQILKESFTFDNIFIKLPSLLISLSLEGGVM